MENLIQKLNNILEISNEFKEKYHNLKIKNKELEVQLSDLKVEADQYKFQINQLQRELEQREQEDKISMLSITNDISKEETCTKQQQQDLKVAAIKNHLDMFIDDIDQCIQLVQKKE